MKKERIKEMFQVNAMLDGIGRRFFETYSELSRSEYILLRYVIHLEETDDKQTISQVAKVLNLSNAAVSRTIKHLLKRGLLVKETLEEDRRSGIIKLSESGRKEFNCFDEKLSQHLDRAFEKVPIEKIDNLLIAMKQMFEDINFDLAE